MSVRVRFAPSPTGLLHIGGARTALYCYLYAKANKGKFVLRIEDTDLERSKKEYEDKMVEDIKWLGVDYDEGPGRPADFGPYRQSERTDLYKKYADQLVDESKAYYCFLTQEELEKLSEKAISEKKAPHAYHDKYRNLDPAEAKKKVDAGESFVIRYKNPQKDFTFKDHVRGEVTFSKDMVGDFVIIRSNGMPVYNFCCVIDDWLMKMSHVIRAEEHLPNTLRQLIIYEGLGADVPEFAHVSLLIGEDRQKLSKRHGATSVVQYKDQHYLPEALVNYLCLLGWSHPDEKDIFKMGDLEGIFDLKRFNKAPALYDIQKLKFFNGEHLRLMNTDKLLEHTKEVLSKEHLFFNESPEWQKKAISFFVSKIDLMTELDFELNVIFDREGEESEELKEIMSWDTTTLMKDYLKTEIENLDEKGEQFVSEEQFANWTNHIKKELKIKGKQLFKGMRAVLTGREHGPDLKVIIPLTRVLLLKERLQS